jgi:hypothetical protein
MQNEPFFKRDGQFYVPQASGRGPWNPQSLHGRVIIGLLGHALEDAFGDEEFIPARLTVDMYKLPGFDPIEVRTSLIRQGGRIRMAEAEFISGGESMAKASCQFLRRTQAPEGEVYSPPNWDVPKPDQIPAPDPGTGPMGRMWATRPISGGFGQPWNSSDKRQMWMSEVRELVEGVPLTPFQRVAVAGDFVSPLAHAAPDGLGYINSDVTLYLHRPMVGEWIGFEKWDHQATDGIAVGECRIYDVEGPIGFGACAAVGQRRMPRPEPAKA